MVRLKVRGLALVLAVELVDEEEGVAPNREGREGRRGGGGGLSEGGGEAFEAADVLGLVVRVGLAEVLGDGQVLEVGEGGRE